MNRTPSRIRRYDDVNLAFIRWLRPGFWGGDTDKPSSPGARDAFYRRLHAELAVIAARCGVTLPSAEELINGVTLYIEDIDVLALESLMRLENHAWHELSFLPSKSRIFERELRWSPGPCGVCLNAEQALTYALWGADNARVPLVDVTHDGDAFYLHDGTGTAVARIAPVVFDPGPLGLPDLIENALSEQLTFDSVRAATALRQIPQLVHLRVDDETERVENEYGHEACGFVCSRTPDNLVHCLRQSLALNFGISLGRDESADLLARAVGASSWGELVGRGELECFGWPTERVIYDERPGNERSVVSRRYYRSMSDAVAAMVTQDPHQTVSGHDLVPVMREAMDVGSLYFELIDDVSGAVRQSCNLARPVFDAYSATSPNAKFIARAQALMAAPDFRAALRTYSAADAPVDLRVVNVLRRAHSKQSAILRVNSSYIVIDGHSLHDSRYEYIVAERYSRDGRFVASCVLTPEQLSRSARGWVTHSGDDQRPFTFGYVSESDWPVLLEFLGRPIADSQE
ncbi:hypothetical protein E4T66_17625 [Sinimarinibacterium sp. CAU 1509]|uniref:hypothetical protein n=1 Tax=Sinimarinibacterium sp. CAU 1509 TaxID=2562283 RepID=UPI0010AC96F1|nr:hypothetical protein [Sinimarinibacterium sp. CAU 1509]TJY57228.1 hypothetical protein E4T66_17625 [Sinimarinibacterium sp. CAU 1509]